MCTPRCFLKKVSEDDFPSAMRDHLDRITPSLRRILWQRFKEELQKCRDLCTETPAQSEESTAPSTSSTYLVPKKAKTKLQDDHVPVKNILINFDGNVIELRNPRFEKGLNAEVERMEIDFAAGIIDLELNLGNITVVTDIECNHINLNKVFPVSALGQHFHFFGNVVMKGRIGLKCTTEFFIPANCDFEYTTSNVDTWTSHNITEDQKIANGLNCRSLESEMVHATWKQTTNLMTDMFARSMAVALYAINVKDFVEMGEDTLRTYYYRCERKAVSIVRAFLAKAKAFISGDTFLDIPGYTAVFRSHPFELSETVHHKYTKLGFFEASRVYVGDLDTLEEEPDWSYHEGRSVVTIYGYLQLQDFRFGCRSYKVGFLDEADRMHGKIECSVRRNRIFVKFIIEKGKEGEQSCITHLQQVNVCILRDIRISASGFRPYCSWAEAETWLQGNFIQVGIPLLEKKISDAFRYAINNVSCNDIAGILGVSTEPPKSKRK